MSRDSFSNPYLLFRSRTRVGALALADVREVMRPLPVEQVAGAPALVMGVAVVRGIPSPVIDAAHLLADPGDLRADRTPPTRFISLRLGARGLCLAVDAVLDVRPLPQEKLHRTPPLLDASESGTLALLGTVDQELLAVLNTARLVPEAVWSALQTEEGRG